MTVCFFQTLTFEVALNTAIKFNVRHLRPFRQIMPMRESRAGPTVQISFITPAYLNSTQDIQDMVPVLACYNADVTTWQIL